MVKAPEKFVNEYLSHNKSLASKAAKKPAKTHKIDVSKEELVRLKQNLQTIWGIYRTPEIKGILSKKQGIRFLNVEGRSASLNLSYVGEGVLMAYELDTGRQKDIAGARVYKQDEMLINKYMTPGKGSMALLKTTDVALKTFADILINTKISESCIWDVIAKGEQLNVVSVACFG